MGKIHDKAEIVLQDGNIIRRNIYACYLDGYTLYARYKGHVHRIRVQLDKYILAEMIA